MAAYSGILRYFRRRLRCGLRVVTGQLFPNLPRMVADISGSRGDDRVLRGSIRDFSGCCPPGCLLFALLSDICGGRAGFPANGVHAAFAPAWFCGFRRAFWPGQRLGPVTARSTNGELYCTTGTSLISVFPGARLMHGSYFQDLGKQSIGLGSILFTLLGRLHFLRPPNPEAKFSVPRWRGQYGHAAA